MLLVPLLAGHCIPLLVPLSLVFCCAGEDPKKFAAKDVLKIVKDACTDYTKAYAPTLPAINYR